ncbi:prolycopene isomerase, chloroplastic-like [Magnolia sinica]|uniref:prolycopene isomerase, chloroplastic-like n=1 Tax=Magnolia sinica TaxID=86752 RepID=UPI00265A45BC|nr:prolycopene isomerase, chloroplastic-like [Magnolia sinica]
MLSDDFAYEYVAELLISGFLKVLLADLIIEDLFDCDCLSCCLLFQAVVVELPFSSAHPVSVSVMYEYSKALHVWIFNALNSLELKSLEEPIYLFGQFFKKPLECLTLVKQHDLYAEDQSRIIFVIVGCRSMKVHSRSPIVSLHRCRVSTVNALQTPVINASMVLCDRHFGGINYPVGGVGGIAKALVKGLVDKGSKILYKANVTNIILEHGKAVRVRLSDGRKFFSKTVISNATRRDTFVMPSKIGTMHLRQSFQLSENS